MSKVMDQGFKHRPSDSRIERERPNGERGHYLEQLKLPETLKFNNIIQWLVNKHSATVFLFSFLNLF